MFIILLVLKKELLQLRRDKRIIIILFISPVIQLIFMGYAATFDIKHIPLIVWDQDRSPASRDLIRHITSTVYFDQIGTAQSYQEIERSMKRSRAKAALVIPLGFQNKLGSGRTAEIQAVFDGSDSNQTLIAQNYLGIIAQQQSARIMSSQLSLITPQAAAQAPAVAAVIERALANGQLAVEPEPRVWHNPELRSTDFMVPGVVVIVLLVVTTMLTALAVVREKEVGTMEQVIVTPIKPWQFILGKLAPYVIIGFIEATLILIMAVLWFRVPFRGHLLSLYGYAALFLLNTLGFGLLISTISHNQQQSMMTTFFFMFVMILFSGFMFPIENMPVPAQWLTRLVPMRYFLVIVRSLFLKGSPLTILWDQALALLALGLVLITTAVLRFHKTLD